MSLRFALCTAATLCLCLTAARAQERVPDEGVITDPGHYVLADDRSGQGPRLVEVEADGVLLDLDGHTLTCTPDDPATAVTFGVYADDVADLTVRNGAITNCTFGLRARGSVDTVVELVDFTGNRYVGADVTGTGARIRGCRFARIGGYEPEAYSIGVNGVGSNAVVHDNLFLDLYRQERAAPDQVGEGVAILIAAGNENTVVRDNWIENTREGEHDNIGIWAARGGGGHVIRRNAITGMPLSVAVAGETTARVVNNRLWLRGEREFFPIVGDAVEAADNLIVHGGEVVAEPGGGANTD